VHPCTTDTAGPDYLVRAQFTVVVTGCAQADIQTAFPAERCFSNNMRRLTHGGRTWESSIFEKCVRERTARRFAETRYE